MGIHEILGLVASALIVFSMVFKTTTFKGTLLMRIINAIGSVFFIVYGFWPSTGEKAFLGTFAFWSGLANSILLVLNIFYLILEVRDYKKGKEGTK